KGFYSLFKTLQQNPFDLCNVCSVNFEAVLFFDILLNKPVGDTIWLDFSVVCVLHFYTDKIVCTFVGQ
ncbi:TPA: hypothetical protein ACGV99_002851, partial [Enterococcus faecium]